MKIKRIAHITVFSIVLFYAVGAAYIGWTDYKAQQNLVILPEGTSLEEARKYYDESIVLMAPATDEMAYPADPEVHVETVPIWDQPLSRILYDVFMTVFLLTVFSWDWPVLSLAAQQAYSWTCCRLTDRKKSGHSGRIYNYIKEHPRCSSNEIMTELGIGRSSLRYHRRFLIQHGVKEELFKGRIYYVMKKEQTTSEDVILKSGKRREMYDKICEMPGISRKGLAEELGIQCRMVSYYSKQLETAHLIDVITDKNTARYYPGDRGISGQSGF